jgi:hypothetical protein
MSVVLSFPVTEMEGEQKKSTDKQPHLFLSSQDGKESDDGQGAPSPVDSQSGAAASVARIDNPHANDPDEHDEEVRIEAPGADSTKTFPQKVESMDCQRRISRGCSSTLIFLLALCPTCS